MRIENTKNVFFMCASDFGSDMRKKLLFIDSPAAVERAERALIR